MCKDDLEYKQFNFEYNAKNERIYKPNSDMNKLNEMPNPSLKILWKDRNEHSKNRF